MQKRNERDPQTVYVMRTRSWVVSFNYSLLRLAVFFLQKDTSYVGTVKFCNEEENVHTDCIQ